jgi:hypothetical protein
MSSSALLNIRYMERRAKTAAVINSASRIWPSQ